MKKHLETFGRLTSPIANVAGILSIFSIGGISYTFFIDYFFQIMTFVGFIVICILLIFMHGYRKLLSPSSDADISEPTIYKTFFQREKELYSKKFEELRDGYMRVLSEDVRRVQVDFIKELEELPEEKRTIKTLDLTTNPEMWLSNSRDKYFQQNKKFISSSSGRIERVLLIDENKLDDGKFIKDLLTLIAKFEKIGVILGLHLYRYLDGKELQDFIIYDGFSVLVEEKQADEKYKLASSIAYFKKNKIDEYSKIFKDVWNGIDRLSAVKMLTEFKTYFGSPPDTKKSKAEFLDHLQQK